MFRKLLSSKGFTLLELIVVISIISLLAMMVVPQVMRQYDNAKSKAVHIEIKGYQTALDFFRLDIGRYPDQKEGLKALVTKPQNLGLWRGPYLKKNTSFKDPWGNAYVYKTPGKQDDYDIVSLGADGKEGGTGEDEDVSGSE